MALMEGKTHRIMQHPESSHTNYSIPVNKLALRLENDAIRTRTFSRDVAVACMRLRQSFDPEKSFFLCVMIKWTKFLDIKT